MPIWTDYPTQTTPDDADTLLAHDVSETVVGKKMKRTTWANIKAAIKALADTYYLDIASKAADSDKLGGVDSTLFARQNAAPVGNQVLTSVAGAPTWAAPDGWTPAPGAWTINTAPNIINVPDSSIFGVGNPIQLTNSTVKQFYVVAIPSGTTVQVYAGSAFALVGATGTALTACSYSKMSMPTGFPGYFTYVSVVDGSTGTIGTYSENSFMSKFSLNGKTCHAQVSKLVTNVGSWSGIARATRPIASKAGANVLGTGFTLATGTASPIGYLINSGGIYFEFQAAIGQAWMNWGAGGLALNHFILVNDVYEIA